MSEHEPGFVNDDELIDDADDFDLDERSRNSSRDDDFGVGLYDVEPDDADDAADDYEDYEDATDDEIDFVVAIYREDSQPVATELSSYLANDLDELIAQLRRLPGDAGAIGIVSIDGDFFVLCRVRGRNVQVLLSDVLAATDWPLARDVVDYLGLDVPDDDDDDESEPVGDLNILADLGVSDLDMEQIAGDLDADSDELVQQLMRMINFERQFLNAID